MHQTTPLQPVLLAAALTARLRGRIAPDEAAEAFLTAGLPVPLIVTDAVFAPPAGDGEEVPTGLLLWEAGARRCGAARVRAEPVHPALPLRVPRLTREARRATARPAARTRALCVVEDAAGTALAVLAIGTEADTAVVPCAPTPFTTVDHLTPAEASRRLRETVMHALAAVEAEGAREVDGLPWRDWQAELAGARDDAAHAALALVLGGHERARSLHTAMHVHHSLSALAVPGQTGGPRLGPALEQVHAAAARVITALTRMDA
ncbi:hypothetical protein [Brevibacterium album]|uniref:hypothetical protein n=1 Tax=Brevibacterium album TaxID=417948 RepID=UPI000684098A|nr:hypothetical protein [Brevibacterium album]